VLNEIKERLRAPFRMNRWRDKLLRSTQAPLQLNQAASLGVGDSDEKWLRDDEAESALSIRHTYAARRDKRR
jgi:hypothetical protein